MNFFPCEASVAGKESIGVLVRGKRFSNVSDSEHKSDDRWAGVGRPGIPTFSIPMDMEGTLLSNLSGVGIGGEITLTVLLQSYLLPFESFSGGLIGLHVPPVSLSQHQFETKTK